MTDKCNCRWCYRHDEPIVIIIPEPTPPNPHVSRPTIKIANAHRNRRDNR